MENQEGYLKKIHEVEVDILDEIVRICDLHQLNYYLIGGTLLGAVRHKGFIPWDDDLDIVMPRSDYDKFCSFCQSELDERYMLHSIDTDKRYWLPFAKIRKKNTLFNESNISTIDAPKGIYVDIFPLDNALCEDSFEQRIRTKKIKAISSVIYFKRGLNIKFTPKTVLLSIIMFPFSIRALSKYQIKLMTKQNKKDCEYYINFGSNYNTVKQTILKSKYDPTAEVEFEGKKYKTLGDYEFFLKRIYGENYMQLPPMEKRVTHRPVEISFDLTADKNISGDKDEEI